MVSVINITNGLIDEITTERNTTFVTVTYADRTNVIRPNQTVRLIVTTIPLFQMKMVILYRSLSFAPA